MASSGIRDTEASVVDGALEIGKVNGLRGNTSLSHRHAPSNQADLARLVEVFSPTLPDLVERESGLRLGEVEDAAGNFGQP